MDTSKRLNTLGLRITFLVFVAALLTACSGLFNAKPTAEDAIAQIHALYNQGRIDAISRLFDPQFRSSTEAQKYSDVMDAMQRKLGKVISSSNCGWELQSSNLHVTVSLSQNTTFERGQGIESFAFAVNGTNAVLLSYNIQSMDLITK